MSMNKLNNQRKITHRAQENPIKSDLMTENTHRNISGTAENESDLNQITSTLPIIQTSRKMLRCFRWSDYLLMERQA